MGLEKTEKLLHRTNPFAVKDFSFTWWDGLEGAAYRGFSVRDSSDLKEYVKSQMAQMKKLALDFAKPAVSFLTAPTMLDASSLKNALLLRWHLIVSGMEGHENRTPGNTPQNLEDFIVGDLSALNTRDMLKKVPINLLNNESSDFFVETLRALKKGARSQAEILQRSHGIEATQGLIRYFNLNLRNKFPFVTANIDTSTEEADPEQIREFYNLYDKAGGNTAVILDQIYQLGDVSKDLVNFFGQMDIIKAFLGSYLEPNSGIYTPTFDFIIDFRASRANEAGGDMVIDWVFKSDSASRFEKKTPKKAGQWVYGNEVSFQFRWPSSHEIPAKPEADTTQPQLTVEGATATFTYKGPWSLLRALRQQKAPTSDGIAQKDQNATLLKFIVPTGKGQKATLYNALSLMVPSSNAKTLGKRMKIPDFPALAPEFSSQILALEKTPVLSSGKMKEAPLPVKAADPVGSNPHNGPQGVTIPEPQVDKPAEKPADKLADKKDKKAEPPHDKTSPKKENQKEQQKSDDDE